MNEKEKIDYEANWLETREKKAVDLLNEAIPKLAEYNTKEAIVKIKEALASLSEPICKTCGGSGKVTVACEQCPEKDSEVCSEDCQVPCSNCQSEPEKETLENSLKLCYAVEELPASEQQTKISIMASNLHQSIGQLQSKLNGYSVIVRQLQKTSIGKGVLLNKQDLEISRLNGIIEKTKEYMSKNCNNSACKKDFLEILNGTAKENKL